MSEKKRPSVEETWDQWKDYFVEPDGSINVENLKKELNDLIFCWSQISKVYCEITGSKLSYTTYYADTVIGIHNEEIQEAYDRGYEDCKKDFGVETDHD